MAGREDKAAERLLRLGAPLSDDGRRRRGREEAVLSHPHARYPAGGFEQFGLVWFRHVSLSVFVSLVRYCLACFRVVLFRFITFRFHLLRFVSLRNLTLRFGFVFGEKGGKEGEVQGGQSPESNI